MDHATGTTHPLLACAATLAETVNGVADLDPVFLTTAEKQRVLLELGRVVDQKGELRGRVLAAADDVALEAGARDAAAWLGHATRVGGPAARRWAAQAEALGRWSRVADAVRQGTVNTEQAVVITRALDRLPTDLDPRILQACEDRLVTEAAHFDPRQLEIIGRRILAVIDPDHADHADAEALDREEHEAARRTFLRWRRNGDGTTDFRGRVSDAVFSRFQAYLEAFTNPRRSDTTSRDTSTPDSGADADAGSGPDTSSAADTDSGADTDTDTEPYPQGPVEDRRPYDQRMGQAFGSFLEAVDPDGLPQHGGDATTITATVDYDALRAQLAGIGWIGDQPITAAQVRRLACQAQILPVVLGGDSQVLDLGRARRLATPAQRKALALRHRHCQAEGCDIPSTWCEAHHLHAWSTGGATDLTDLVLLCSFHHHRAHDTHYDTRCDTAHDARGRLTDVLTLHRRT